MVASAEESPLRDTAMRSDGDFVEAEQIDFLADPAVVADFEPPWHCDIHSRSNHHAPTDACSKGTQERPLDAGRPGPCTQKENDF